MEKVTIDPGPFGCDAARTHVADIWDEIWWIRGFGDSGIWDTTKFGGYFLFYVGRQEAEDGGSWILEIAGSLESKFSEYCFWRREELNTE